MAAWSMRWPQERAAPRSDEAGGASNTAAYVHLLRGFARSRDLQSGILIHDHIVSRGLDRDPDLADHLVHMYAKCGSHESARNVFERMPAPGILAWNRMISGYAQRRESAAAIAIFWRMLLEGVRPSRITFVAVLGACRSPKFLPAGKKIHSQIAAAGYASCVIVSTALIDMYADCGSLRRAVRVFQAMENRDAVGWTAMLGAYARFGHTSKAILCYRRILLEGFLPTIVTFVVLLNFLAEDRDWDRGRWIHIHITEMELESELVVAVALVTMFGRCGDLKKARRVFRKIWRPDLAAYNALLAAHVETGQFWNALLLFRRMQEDGVAPDRESLLIALEACLSPSDLEHGKKVHVSAINHGLETDIEVANALISMYSKCASLRDAEWMFQRMEGPDLISWKTLIAAYVKHDQGGVAFRCFRKFLLEGISPDRNILLIGICACGSSGLLRHAREVFDIVQECGLDSDSRVLNGMVETYGKCKCLEGACKTFELIKQPNSSSWNQIVGAYLECGRLEEALQQTRKAQLEGVKMKNRRSITYFVNAITACSSLCDLEGIQSWIGETGMGSSSAIGKALLGGYCRLRGSLEDAERVLMEMDHNRDKTAWDSMFALCGGKNKAASGKIRDPLSVAHVGSLFRKLLLDGLRPDKSTFALLLHACIQQRQEREDIDASVAELIHSCIVECELEGDITIASLLLIVYGQCQALNQASAIFNKSYHLGAAVWNAMIEAFAENGLPENGFLLFQRMLREGVTPDTWSFVRVLDAIGAVGGSGLDQGRVIHCEAVEMGVEMDSIVATAIIRMYGSCGCVEAAMDVFSRMERDDRRKIATLDAMISAFASAGRRDHALELLRDVHLQDLAFQIRQEVFQDTRK